MLVRQGINGGGLLASFLSISSGDRGTDLRMPFLVDAPLSRFSGFATASAMAIWKCDTLSKNTDDGIDWL